MQSQVYILFAAAAVMFLVIGGLFLLAHYYTLNGIKSRTVGDGQHGTARFATKQEIKSIYKHIPFQPELWRKGQNLPAVSEQGIILGSTGAKNKVTALVDTDAIAHELTGPQGGAMPALIAALGPEIVDAQRPYLDAPFHTGRSSFTSLGSWSAWSTTLTCLFPGRGWSEL